MAKGTDNRGGNDMTGAGDFLDARLLQKMQDHFCATSNLYCVCLSTTQGVVTKAYGSREELDYIHGKISMNRHVVLLHRLLEEDAQDMIEEKLEDPYLKMCGIGIRVGGKIAAIWICIGVIKEEGINGADVPPCIKTTTTEQFYHAVRFLEVLTRQYFVIRLDEILAHEAFVKSRDTQKQIESELQRNEALTGVLQNLESEESFRTIAEDILKKTCEHLDVGSGALLRISKDGKTVDMTHEYVRSAADHPKQPLMQEAPIGNFPPLDGRQYVVSTDTDTPQEFQKLFAVYKYRAAALLPVELGSKTDTYLMFAEENTERVFTEEDICFLNEVKQIVQSILSKRIAKNSLASSYAALEAILENVGCGICVRDTIKGKNLYTNHRLLRLFPGIGLERAVDLIFNEKKSVGSTGRFYECYSEEENRWYDVCHTKIRWVDGKNVILSTVYDVTEKKLYQQKIERQANNDFLTGLYNRMRCEHDIEHHIGQAKKAGGQGALLYLDLDDFKHINDGLGHQYGDVLLKAISHNLQRVHGIESTCYRMGGDEFIVLVTNDHFHMLGQILKEIQAIFAKPWFLKGADYYCTMSMGVAVFPKDGDSVQDLIKKADLALYGAKNAGKNRIEFYDDNDEISSFKRLDLEKNMRHATINACDEFEVYYQPVVDISRPGDPCAGAEALIRWNSQKMGLISPNEFIPLAEYLGLINPIGQFVLREACMQLRRWNEMGHPNYRINVNLSVVQLLQNDVVEQIQSVIEETGVNPSNLTLEVTESLAINDMERMKRILGEIKKLGVWVALDDFGTGYSSLNHIREIPIDIIKIDRCFIVDISKDGYSEVFVKMVAELAETLGLHMCVEGVEEEDQLEKLREMKVQYIQGFYFGRPMCAKDFEEKYL